MKRHLRYVRAVLAALALLSFSQIISAQEITGAVNGTVKDSNGAAIGGATVTISDADKQVVVRTVTTNEGGDFSAPNLLSGFYDISVEAPNFKDNDNYYSNLTDNFFTPNEFPPCNVNIKATEIMAKTEADQ